MLDVLVYNPWLLAILWSGMYVFDYISTRWLAATYQATFSRYVVYEHGVELNPNWEKEIAGQKRSGPKFLLLLALVAVIILLSPLIGYLFTEFLAGATLLTWSFINSRHLRNYAFARALRRKPDALQGVQKQSYWFLQRMLSAEALAWSLLYLFLTVLTWRIFFLAGTLTCLALGIRAYRLANRKFGGTSAAIPKEQQTGESG